VIQFPSPLLTYDGLRKLLLFGCSPKTKGLASAGAGWDYS